MAGKAVGAVLALPTSVVAGSARLLLVALANYGNPDGSRVYPSVPTLSRATGISERQIRRLLRQLEAAGLLVMVRPAYHYRPVTYQLNIPRIRDDIAMSGRGDIAMSPRSVNRSVRTYPPTPLLRGGLNTGRKRLTPKLLDHVQRIRQNRCGCIHEPRCASYEACLHAIAREMGPAAVSGGGG